MSTTNLRVLVAGVAAALALLTGILAGFAGASGPGGTCVVTRTVTVTVHQQPNGPETQDAPRETGRTNEGACGAAAGGSSFAPGAAVVGFLGAALAAGVALAFLFWPRREQTAAPAAASADPALRQHLGAVESERATLRDTCIYVRDRATSKAIADRLGWALGEVGVATVAPAGVRFDPAHHEAGGAAPTTDGAKIGTIAAVEVPGYLDRGVVVRAPVVTVYREERK